MERPARGAHVLSLLPWAGTSLAPADLPSARSPAALSSPSLCAAADSAVPGGAPSFCASWVSVHSSISSLLPVTQSGQILPQRPLHPESVSSGRVTQRLTLHPHPLSLPPSFSQHQMGCLLSREASTAFALNPLFSAPQLDMSLYALISILYSRHRKGIFMESRKPPSQQPGFFFFFYGRAL